MAEILGRGGKSEERDREKKEGMRGRDTGRARRKRGKNKRGSRKGNTLSFQVLL